MNKETINVKDEKGFIYEVNIQHSPQHGFSTAYYRGGIIGQSELGRITHPLSDDDREWEQYEELFDDWKCEIKANLIRQCEEFFNQTN